MCRISDLAKEGYCIILSTHNPDHAFLYANRTLMIYGGRVIADGAPENVLDAQLIKHVYGVDVHIEDYQYGSFFPSTYPGLRLLGTKPGRR